MTEVKADYVVNIAAPPKEYKCTCGNVLGYLRNAGNWVVLLSTSGLLIKGEAWVYCPKCKQHRHFVEVMRTVPAFLDVDRNKAAEDILALLEEAKRLYSKLD